MSWVYNARRFNHDFTKRFQTLVSKFNSKLTEDNNQATGQELQSTMEGANTRTYLTFYDNDLQYLDGNLDTTVLSTVLTSLAEEPDGNYLKAYIEFDSVGGNVPDRSGFGHNVKTYGIGRMRKGIEYGRGSNSFETVFDGRSTYAEIEDHADFSIDYTNSFSLQFRFLPFDLVPSEGGLRRVVISKIDSYNTNTWFSFELDHSGKAIFNLVVTNTVYSISTPADTIVPVPYGFIDSGTERYDVVVTWDNTTDHILKLYINSVLYDTVTSSLDDNTRIPDYYGTNIQIGRFTNIVSNVWDSALILVNSDFDRPEEYSENGVFIGTNTGTTSSVITTGNKYPPRFKSKLYFGTFQQLKFWSNKVLTDTEIFNHYTNKLTITAIPRLNVSIPEGVVLLDT